MRVGILGILAVFLLLPVIYSCGYALHGKTSLPFHAIRIEGIENGTDEPKLEDKLIVALTDEFLREGISVVPGAEYSLRGRIDVFELRTLSEKSDLAVAYELVMRGSFRIAGPAGYEREVKDVASPFIVSFPGEGPLSMLLSEKERASEKAVREMAAHVVAAILYR